MKASFAMVTALTTISGRRDRPSSASTPAFARRVISGRVTAVVTRGGRLPGGVSATWGLPGTTPANRPRCDARSLSRLLSLDDFTGVASARRRRGYSDELLFMLRRTGNRSG